MNDNSALSFQLLFVDSIDVNPDGNQEDKPCVPTAGSSDQPTLPFPGIG